MTRVQFSPDYFNPFSAELSEAGRKFSKIDAIEKKIMIVVATIFAALFTLPFGGIGGAAAFRYLVEKVTERPKGELDSQTGRVKDLNPNDSLKDDVNPNEVDNLNPIDPSKSAAAEEIILPDSSSKEVDLFVNVLNAEGYIYKGKAVKIPAPSKPEKIEMVADYETKIAELKELMGNKAKPTYQVLDLSTEDAIAVNDGYAKIAINFANEHHAGGGPGIHLDPISEKIVYDCNSAKAQEESLCQHSDLMVSLTKLPHFLKKDLGSQMVRSFYKEPFDSRKMAYISHNHLFALRGATFYESEYLEHPMPVCFVTTAAPILHGKNVLPEDQYVQDVRLRIKTHLWASAQAALELNQVEPGAAHPYLNTPLTPPNKLILGAFGCGAFAPTNAKEYAKIVAGLYMEELKKYEGIFDEVIFAVPTFGSTNPNNPAYRNYLAFKEAI